MLVLNEIRAVHKLVNAVHLDDGAAISKHFAGGAPIAVARVGCIVLMLLDANADCEAVDAKGHSALMKAAQGGYVIVVKILLEAGANPIACDKSGDTPLLLAARHGKSRTVKCLAQLGGVDVSAVNDKQESALYLAVKNGDTDSINILIDELASITTGFGSHGSAVYLAAHLGLRHCLEVFVDDGGKLIDLEGEGMPSPLLQAVQSQDIDAVLMLLSHGACVSNWYFNCNTLLHIASDAKSVELLTKFGARADGRNLSMCTPVHCAVIDGKRDVLEALLKADVRVDIDAKTDEGMTALHYAVRKGDTRAITTLLLNGADARVRTKCRATPLHMAIELNLLDVVRTLVGDGAHATSTVDKSEPTPLKKECCGKSNAKLLPSPRKQPAGVSQKSKHTGEGGVEDLRSAEHEDWLAAFFIFTRCSICVNSVNGLGESPLHVAASVGNIEVARTLLANGARAQAIDKRRATPLHNAVLYAHHDIVLALLAGGPNGGPANVGWANEEGKTALHIACDFGGLLSLATIDALLAHGASVACKEINGCTPLHMTIQSLDQNEAVSAEVEPHEKSPSVSESGGREESATFHASVNKSGEEVVAFLLDHGAPVDAKNNQGKSPLRLACEKGHVGIARLLLRAGASPGTGGEKGICPLHTACSRGDVELVKVLLDAGALPGHCWNSRGVSPLYVAAEWGHLSAVKALLPRLNKRQIDMSSTLGTAPLIVAVKRRDKDIVAALVKAGADVTARTPEGLGPLSVIAGIASNPDSADIVRSLLEGGAKPDAFCVVDGFMPLHTACAAGGDAGVVQALLAGKAGINSPCPGEDFLLPLHLAAKNGHAEAARAIATTPGCRLDEKANNGATALTMAISDGHTETVRALLESGALLEKNVLDESGVDIGSHVHVAILNGHVRTCRLLLQAATLEARARNVQP
ncbi:unnamed protein product [Laminaria digitata]